MARRIVRRGPDDEGVWADGEMGLALAHRRLAVLDLSPAGHQPMLSSCGRCVLVFNGEIYNHLELRKAVDAGGEPYPWRGHSDTETLLACVVRWGLKETLRKSTGMFALAVWDRFERTLSLARDRFGEKPLYYGWTGTGENRSFVFGSELKALKAYPGFDNPVDRRALGLYFNHCAVPSPWSIYKDVYKLEPGTIVCVRQNDVAAPSVQAEPYWRYADLVRRGIDNPVVDEQLAVSELDRLLGKAVSGQMAADVPLGAFLSGGVDSSVIVALMQAHSPRPVKTFTVGFDEAGFDESPYAAAVARHLGTDHHEMRVSAEDARAVIPSLPELYDEPFADSSQIPTFLVCRAARQHVTVALSGDGGDELFGGYNRYFWGSRIWRRLAWMPTALRKSVGSGVRSVPIELWDGVGRMMPNRIRLARMGDKLNKLAHCLPVVDSLDDLYRSLVTEWYDVGHLVSAMPNLEPRFRDEHLSDLLVDAEHRMMYWDAISYLPDDILTKVDRAAMGVSLETRVPILDHAVAAFAWRLPLHMKIRNGQGKWVLRQVLYRYVPQELIERPKVGFAIPVGQWLRGPLREWSESLLDEQRIRQDGFLDPALVRETWRQHLSGRHDWTVRLWAILMFNAWLTGEA